MNTCYLFRFCSRACEPIGTSIVELVQAACLSIPIRSQIQNLGRPGRIGEFNDRGDFYGFRLTRAQQFCPSSNHKQSLAPDPRRSDN